MSAITPKAYYPHHGDNRLDMPEIEFDDLEVRLQSAAVCCFINRANLTRKTDFLGEEYIKVKKNVTTLAEAQEEKFSKKEAKFHDKEKYGNQQCAGRATGFLIARKVIMTANHVIKQIDFKQDYVVFGFKMWNTKDISQIHPQDVCQIVRVLNSSDLSGKGEDWAICEINQEPYSGYPLSLNLNYKVEENDTLSMIGHPSGLPQKYVPQGSVKPNKDAKARQLTQNQKDHTYQLAIAAFHGNSGSPMIKMVRVWEF